MTEAGFSFHLAPLIPYSIGGVPPSARIIGDMVPLPKSYASSRGPRSAFGTFFLRGVKLHGMHPALRKSSASVLRPGARVVVRKIEIFCPRSLGHPCVLCGTPLEG